MGNDDGRRSRVGAAGLLFVLLGVVFGTGRLTGGGGDGPSKEPASQAEKAEKSDEKHKSAATENDYRRPYLEFRGGLDGETRTLPDPALNLGQILASDFTKGRIDAQFLIATVPDPIDSRFGYRFDSVLDAVQMAVESRGWRLDRSWLPWWPSGRQLGDREKLKPVDDGSDSVDRLLHEAKPGVMLFRGKRKDHHVRQPLLVVLLVGETPTSGIAKGAVAESLNIIDSYHHAVWAGSAARHVMEWISNCPDVDVPSQGEVRIIGPFFSGSAPSLASAISGWSAGRKKKSWQHPVTVSVRSGSAARMNKEKFQNAAGDGKFKTRIVFDSTVLHLDAVMPSLFKFLQTCNGGRPLGKVALLTESDTEFGAVRSDASRRWADARLGYDLQLMPPRIKVSDIPTKRKGLIIVALVDQLLHVRIFDDDGTMIENGPLESTTKHAQSIERLKKQLESLWPPRKLNESEKVPVIASVISIIGHTKETRVTTMKFPFHISELAVAYDQRDRKEGKSGTTLVRPSSRLTIPFDEMGNPRDVVPSLSPAMDTATNEFLMSKILETIAMEDYRYVGINASDTRDVIFLAGLIHQYCPDVQLFVTEGDLRLGHPRYTSELRGMVVATSYPLFSTSQKWTPPYKGEGRRHLFSHQSDQGVFNAVVSLLDDQDEEGEYYEALYDYGPPFEEMKNLSRFATIDPKTHLPTVPPQNRGERSVTWSQPLLRPSLWFNVVGARGLWPVHHEALNDPRNNLGYTFTAEPKRYRLRLSRVNDPKDIPTKGKNLIVVAGMNQGLHFRIFDEHGKQAVDTKGEGLKAQAEPIQQLTKQLEGLWPPHELSRIESDQVITAVTTILDHTIQPKEVDEIEVVRFVRRFLAFIPQFSWQWVTAFIGLGLLAWLLFVHHSLMVHSPAESRLSRGVPGMWWIAPSSLTDPRSAAGTRPIAVSPREPFALAGLIAFTIFYIYVALTPCWIAFLESPWRLFLRPGHWGHIPSNDVWNIAIGEMAFCGGHVTLAALSWTIIRRIRYALGRRVDTGSTARKGSVAGDVALLLLVLLPLIALTALAPLEWQYQVGKFSGLLLFDRAANLGSGFSPFVPVLILLTIFLFWVAMQTRRIDLAERSWEPDTASASGGAPLAGVGRQVLGLGRISVRHFKGFMADTTASLAFPLMQFVGLRPQPGADAPPRTQRDCGPSKGGRRKKRRREARTTAAARVGPDSAAGTPHANLEANPHTTRPPAPSQVSHSTMFRVRRPGTERRLACLKAAYEDARNRVRDPWPVALWGRLWHVTASTLALIVLVCLTQRALSSVDFPGRQTTALMTAIWFLALTVILALSRFLQIWLSLRRLLRQYMALPMARAFDRIPPIFSRSFGRYLDRTHELGELLTIPIQQWEVVAEGFNQEKVTPLLKARYSRGLNVTTDGRVDPFEDVAATITARDPQQADPPGKPGAAERIQELFQEEFRKAPSGSDGDSPPRPAFADTSTWNHLHAASRACLDVLDAYWLAKTTGTSFGDAKTEGAGSSPAKDDEFLGTDEVENRWLRSAEDLIAMAILTHISLIAAHLKNLASYLSVAPILLLLAVSSYPFQPGRFLEVCVCGLLLMVVGCVVWVYIGMEQDELLSRVSKTTPGTIAFDRQFLGSVMTFLVPLLGLALAQFPFVSDAMNQWFAPLTRVLK
jgi:hypothetical protein